MKTFFISFGADDTALARFLQKYLNDVFQNSAEFFLADLLPPSSDWNEHLRRQIDLADAALFVLTHRSFARPWVNIELGAFWLLRKPIFPLLAGGLRILDVPRPLADFQAVSLEDPESVPGLIRKISEVCGLDTPPNYSAGDFCRDLAKSISGIGKFRDMSGISQKLGYVSPDAPAPLNHSILSVEPRQLSAEILRGDTLQVTGNILDTGILCLTFPPFQTIDFLIVEAQHADRFRSRHFDKMVKIVVNDNPVLPFFASQRHLDDSQYIPRQDGFFAYDLRDVQTELQFIVKLVFWRCEMQKVHFRVYQIPEKNRKTHSVRGETLAAH